MATPQTAWHGAQAAGTGRLLHSAAAIALLVALAATGWTFWTRSGLSEDEFFQLSFLNTPMPQFFAQFLRLDQHPPFHFLQLLPWSAVSQSDGWMLANSLFWQLVSIGVIWAVGRAWLGGPAGLLAAALYALMPQVTQAATMLRFYALMPALAVGAWWLHVHLLSAQRRAAWQWWALALVQVALVYTHAIAFYFVFWITLAAVVQQWAAVGRQAPWRHWLLVQLGVLLAVLPQVGLTVARGLVARGAGEVQGGNSDPGNLIDHFGGMTAGWGMQWEAARVAGALLFGAALVLGLMQPRTRRMTALLLVGPYAVAMLIGWLLTPMYKTPVYSAVLVPFACLALAGAVAQAGSRAAQGAAVALLVAMAVFVWPAAAHLNRFVSPYKPVAAELQRQVRPGDVVLVPKHYLYWATLRYAVGPRWGSPLEVLPVLSGPWLRLTEKLGPQWSQRLHLLPSQQQVVHDGVVYRIDGDALAATAQAPRVWLVARTNYPMPIRIDPALADQGVVFEAGAPETVQIRLYAR